MLNGYGLGEVHHGGYAERARVKGDWLIRLPENISTANAMAIGTAGYTAMLCVLALEKAGITPDKGDVLVTGAAGGVGSVAIALLDKLGYRVVASSRRAEQEADYLQGIGADEIIDARELSGAGSPWTRSAGRVRWTRSAAARWPTCSRRSNTTAQWRPAAWHKVGSARDRHAVHPTRRDPCRRELSLDPAREARRGLGSSGDGPRPREAQRMTSRARPRRRAGLGGRNPRGKNARDGWSLIHLNTDQWEDRASANIGRYYPSTVFGSISRLPETEQCPARRLSASALKSRKGR